MWRGGYWDVESIGYWDVARRLLGCGEEATGMWRGGYWDIERRLLGCGEEATGMWSGGYWDLEHLDVERRDVAR